MKWILCACIMCCCAAAWASDHDGRWYDAADDAAYHRTDLGNDGQIFAGSAPIDLLEVEVTGWVTPTPLTNPYDGAVVLNDSADLMRVKVRLSGVVAPPGPLGIGETGGEYDPLKFGTAPLYGTIDFDIDDQKNSGGELGDLALNRYLANVGRFGTTPEGSLADRIARTGSDLDDNFWTDPQYERTGAEFAIVMCGCWLPEIISQNGDHDSVFEAGETWIVRGRFFQRVQSFEAVSGLFGGSDFGLFDPPVNVRWSHDTDLNETTVELVFPLTMAGAAMLTGQPEQPMDLSLFNHTSLAEAICDFVAGADDADDELRELLHDWRGRDWEDYIDPTEWRVTALVGTAYLHPESDAMFVWTDTGFNERTGDCNGDGMSSSLDQLLVQSFINSRDGTAGDCDGTVDGSVEICSFSRNFNLYDFNYDGVVDACDRTTLGSGGDTNNDGVLNFFDVSLFLQWFSSDDDRADLDGDGAYDFFDVQSFLQRFSAGCP